LWRVLSSGIYLLKVNRPFGEIYPLHFQGRRINQARNLREAGGSAYYLLQTGVLLGLFSDTEDGDSMFLLKVCSLPPEYTALYLRKYNSS
jgi:hypothetical protein